MRRAPVARISTPSSSAVGGSTFRNRSSRSDSVGVVRAATDVEVVDEAASGGVHRPRRLRDQLDLSDGRPLGRTHSLEAVDVGERREQPTPGERERDRHHPAADDRRHRPDEIRGEP